MKSLLIFRHDERPMLLLKSWPNNEESEDVGYTYSVSVWDGNQWLQRIFWPVETEGQSFHLFDSSHKAYSEAGYTLAVEWSDRTGSPMICRSNHETIEGETATAIALALGYEDAGELAENQGRLICRVCAHLCHPDDGDYCDKHTHDWICDNCLHDFEFTSRAALLACFQSSPPTIAEPGTSVYSSLSTKI